jgi:hypothetical protein
LHELGHALGLYHPHDKGGNSSIIKGTNYNNYSSGYYKQNNFIYTVMTYNDYNSNYGPKKYIRRGKKVYSRYGYVKSWMSYDIEALQYLYGKTKNPVVNNIYYITKNKWICINDSRGKNTISAKKLNKGAVINLNNANLKKKSKKAGGYISTSNNKSGILISKKSRINRAVGSKYNDIIYSNNKWNKINSKGGNDIIYATNGIVYCGTGTDKVIIKNINKTKKLFINGQSGKDTLIIKLKFREIGKIYCNKRKRITIFKKRNKGKIMIKNIQIIKFLDKKIYTKKYINEAFLTKRIRYIKPY